jgi:predicted NUDIX family NTP pyrophosphohydrolase
MEGEPVALGDFRQKGGKIVTAFALLGDFNTDGLRSNKFRMEWPPKSGRTTEFPEIDRAGWFPLAEAAVKIVVGQRRILDALAERLRGAP